jgi:hypothetical protein
MRVVRLPLRLFQPPVFSFLLLLCLASSLRAQKADSSDALMKEAPTVYLTCSSCDEAFIRTEITFVNYVRDPAQADAHILVTGQSTGGGGNAYTLTFIGGNRMAGLNDTLQFSTMQSATDDDIRRQMARWLKTGLARYVARTPLAQHLSVTYDKPAANQDVHDAWDSWVFTVRSSLNTDGEKSMRSIWMSGGLTARRVTENWKLNFSFSSDYNERWFRFDDSTELTSFSRGQYFNALAVKSLGDHWSTGLTGGAYRSTFENIKTSVSVAPAVEYDIYPYAEATRQQIRLQYRLGVTHQIYFDSTIYDKVAETLGSQSLSASAEYQQPWGSLSMSLEGTSYLHDFTKRRFMVFAGLTLRLFEGLSFNVVGNYSLIHDQLSLPKGEATQDEVLLQRRQLETNYRYYAFVGLSYTFGSMYNNVVNPRFGELGGSSISISF